MAALDKFYRFITLDVAGCPLPIIDQEIVNTAVDFCKRTGVWRAWSEPQTVVANSDLYEIAIPAGAIVRQVEFISIGADIIKTTSDLAISGTNPTWQTDTGKSIQAVYDDETKSVRIVPAPVNGGDTIRFLVSFVPKYDATTVPDILYERFAEGFSAGVKARLQVKKQAWADPAAAQVNGAFFGDAIDDAIAFTTKQAMRAPLRSKAVV